MAEHFFFFLLPPPFPPPTQLSDSNWQNQKAGENNAKSVMYSVLAIS